MKNHITKLLHEALTALCGQQLLPFESSSVSVQVETARDPQHGEFASNIAMILAKKAAQRL